MKSNNKFFGGSSYFSFVTSDDNLDVTVTSADSVNVPESSMSSTFFDKNNHASLSSSNTLFIVDTQEMNLQDHLLVYFEFDLGKNNFTFVFKSV